MAGQLIPRGPRTYLIRIYLGRDTSGKRQYFNKTVHCTKREADEERTRLVRLRDTGEPLTPPPEPEDVTLDEYFDTWLETTAKPSVRPRTYEDYKGDLRRYARPYLGGTRLKALAPSDVRRMLVQLREKGLASPTIRRAHATLRAALEQAVVDGLIPDNPARGRLVRKAMPPKKRVQRPTVTPATLPAFLEAAAEDRLHAYWCVLVLGGLRPEEALALRWSDFTGDAVRVQRVLVDTSALPHDFEEPKTDSSRRTVVLPRLVAAALHAHRKRQLEERLAAGPAWEDQDLMFTTFDGRPLRQDQTRPGFKRILQAAKLPAMRIYDLRHSAATLLLEAGEDLKVVSERLGHSTITLTADTYAHVTRGMQERAAAKLDAMIGGGV